MSSMLKWLDKLAMISQVWNSAGVWPRLGTMTFERVGFPVSCAGLVGWGSHWAYLGQQLRCMKIRTFFFFVGSVAQTPNEIKKMIVMVMMITSEDDENDNNNDNDTLVNA